MGLASHGGLRSASRWRFMIPAIRNPCISRLSLSREPLWRALGARSKDTTDWAERTMDYFVSDALTDGRRFLSCHGAPDRLKPQYHPYCGRPQSRDALGNPRPPCNHARCLTERKQTVGSPHMRHLHSPLFGQTAGIADFSNARLTHISRPVCSRLRERRVRG